MSEGNNLCVVCVWVYWFLILPIHFNQLGALRCPAVQTGEVITPEFWQWVLGMCVISTFQVIPRLRISNVGPRKFHKNPLPLPLDKQNRTNSILCCTHHLLYDPYMTCLLLKALPHCSQAVGRTLIGNRLITMHPDLCHTGGRLNYILPCSIHLSWPIILVRIGAQFWWAQVGVHCYEPISN